MRYEIVYPTTGEGMTLGYPDWLRLLALASRYGGLPGEGLYHYCEEDGGGYPRGDGGEPGGGAGRGGTGPASSRSAPTDPEALLEGPREGTLAYFAGERRAISGFVRMGRTGELEVTRHRS